MSDTRTVSTVRLLLRPHGTADLAALTAIHTHPIVAAGLAGSEAPSAEECWQRLLRYAGHWALFGSGMFAVELRTSGRVIGEVGLASFARGLGERFDHAPEAAWIFHPDAHGQGLAFEAVATAHAWLERRRGPARTVCIIRPGNAPSLRLAARLGYRAFGSAVYKGADVLMLDRQSETA